ncbi:MASE3 domain-containing protein [Pelosinus sp. sgz500959]|uniref:MASE3 domain-containing protein n=1 Tax=Pelosinus sp. sgz500959 TaxID=3242472 RepID=UPI00366F81B2
MKSEERIRRFFFNPFDWEDYLVSLFYIGCSLSLFLILDLFQSYNHLLFHSIAEMMSISSSLIIFIVTLHMWKQLDNNNYLSFLGIAFFFIGLTDTLHMLAYKGMPIFYGFDSDLSTQLWMLGRYLQGFSLLIGALLIKRNKQINQLAIVSVYTFIVGVSLISIFEWKIFPKCFIEGYGLTNFAIMSEYVICIVLIASAIVMWKQRFSFTRKILMLLFSSILFQICAELTFIIYNHIYAFSNLLGHYFKIISIMIFCKAILITVVKSPNHFFYARLKRKQEQLKEAQRIGNMGSWELNIVTNHFRCSSQTVRILEWDYCKGEVSYELFLEMVHPEDREQRNDIFAAAIKSRKIYENIHRLLLPNGSSKVVHERGELSYSESFHPIKMNCIIKDITESRRVHERLEKYKILAEKTNDAMLFVDKDGRILEANDAAIKMYGYTVESLLSMSIFDLRCSEKNACVIEQMQIADHEGITFETIHYRQNGTAIPVEISSKGTFLGDRKVFLSIIRDITDRKKAEEEILIALKKAETANAAKSQFLANMSHEIRTPMNGIMGMTDLALMTELSEEQREYLSIIKSSTNSLLRVVNDILDYSKIEAGQIDIEQVPFDLRNTIHEVIDLFAIGAKEKGLSIRLNFNEMIPRYIIGDSVRLRQVLSNLVGNGIKFTSEGEIIIHVDREEQDSHNVKIRFAVSDTGIGIPEDKRDKLFKRFSQVDDSNTRQFGGTGLGLAISKKLIEMMGGLIGVESEENVGSHFFFEVVFGIPVKKDDCIISKDVIYKQSLQSKNTVMKKVLLVEDDTVSRDMVTIMLERKGFTVLTAVNGKKAVSAFEKEQFDIIIMDINMPDLDGYAATAMIRLKERTLKTRTPIIAMTAYALQGDREKCLQSGMDDYISKPIDFNQVIEVLDKHIKMGSTENYEVQDKDT